MCQTRCGESRLKRIYKGIAVNKITSKYYVKSSMSKVESVKMAGAISKRYETLGRKLGCYIADV